MIRDEETGRSGGGQLSSNLSQFGGASGDNTARLSSYGIVIARIHEHDNRFQPVDETFDRYYSKNRLSPLSAFRSTRFGNKFVVKFAKIYRAKERIFLSKPTIFPF